MNEFVSTKCESHFYFKNPDLGTIHIQDIAHSLSNLCRFNGHCREFYSVAEHCCRVHDVLPNAFRLWGLMHDAAEAYLGDVIGPVKVLLPEFKKLEDNLLKKIAKRFELEWPVPSLVHLKDLAMCKAEALDLLEEDFDWIKGQVCTKDFRCWEPRVAQEQFMERYNESFRGT